MSALQEQHGGSHYMNMDIQPIEFIHSNGLGYDEGTAIAYLSRWKNKGGVADLRKAKHHIELLIQFRESGSKWTPHKTGDEWTRTSAPRGTAPHRDSFHIISAGEYVKANSIGELEGKAIRLLTDWNTREDLDAAVSSINALILEVLDL